MLVSTKKTNRLRMSVKMIESLGTRKTANIVRNAQHLVTFSLIIPHGMTNTDTRKYFVFTVHHTTNAYLNIRSTKPWRK